MELISTPTLLALCGVMLGFVMGATARRTKFCTFGAVEDYILIGRLTRLKAWALAIATAMICVQILHHFNIARIDEVFYLNSKFGLVGSVVGGLLFGLGMAMVGTCGFGVIVRTAGGDLKALTSFLVMGISAYMAARGLTSHIKVYAIDSFIINLDSIGGQGIPHIFQWLAGIDVKYLWLPVGLTIGGSLLFFCFRGKEFKNNKPDIFAGIIIGLAVTSGFVVTGVLGADPFEMSRVESITYVLPLGETLIWLMTLNSTSVTFAIAIVIGTFLGALSVALLQHDFRLEGFDDVREMKRHFLGAVAMGAGGVTALGCTIGQGISGISTLAVSPILSLISIFLGATFGLHWLLSGNAKEAFLLLIKFK